MNFKKVYTWALISFVVLETLAVWSTYTIIGRGGVEVYPLAVGMVDNVWLLLGSKIFAVLLLAVPLWVLHKYFLPKYQNQKRMAFITVCGAIGIVLSVAAFDVAHNISVLC